MSKGVFVGRRSVVVWRGEFLNRRSFPRAFWQDGVSALTERRGPEGDFPNGGVERFEGWGVFWNGLLRLNFRHKKRLGGDDG